MIIQIPIIFSLFFVIRKMALDGVIDGNLLYSIIPNPGEMNMNFLGLFDVSKSAASALQAGMYLTLLFPVLAGITQFFQARYAMPTPPKRAENTKDINFKDEMMRGMHIQMRYVMPVMTFFISFGFPSVIAIYWTISNLFAIGQEIYIRKKVRLEKNNQDNQ
jgi:YidC/Oxa1 family membrane protein insertase